MSSARQEKTAIRRANGQIACSECSRLKLKCDRKLPACGSCVRRGCEYICPNGTLPQAKKKSSPASDGQTSHLTARIQQLEDALAILQSSSSSERHPLLREELLQIKFGKKQAQQPVLQTAEVLADSLGTMTVSPHGDAKYFGPSAGAESLFQAGAESLNLSDLPDAMTESLRSFPFDTHTGVVNLDCLLQLLPPKPRAWSLCESYLQQGRLKERLLERDELINELLIPVYNRDDLRLQEQSRSFSPHKLASLFLVFAIGARVDLTIPFDSDESSKYLQLGQAALSLSPVLNSTELITVQALALLAFSYAQGGRMYDIDTAGMLLGMAVKCAESIGLHRDSPQWIFDAKTLNRRRLVGWEVFTFDIRKPVESHLDPLLIDEEVYSLTLGRPPSITPTYIDCQFPVDEDAVVDDKGQVHPGRTFLLNARPNIHHFVADRWRWMFSREIGSQVLETTLTSTPQYSTVLELDRKLREFPFPPHFHVTFSADESVDDPTPYLYFKRNYPVQIRAMTALHIHRNFFAETLLHYASDPLGSPYATSFLASYKASSVTIAMYVKHMTRWPDLLLRWWPIWTSLLAATMVVGAIVVRCPGSTVATKAYMELGLSVAMFEKGAEQSDRARSGLVTIRKLMARATESFSHRHESGFQAGGGDANLGEELEIFAGRTKFLVSTLLSQHRLVHRNPSLPTDSLPTPESSATPPSDIQQTVPNSNGLPELAPEWFSVIPDTPSSSIPFSPELMDPVFMDTEGTTQHEGMWDSQSALNTEWFSFMEQAGLLDQMIVNNTML